MDYCDDCGKAAEFRCLIDGSYACSTHKHRYPFDFHRYIEQAEAPGPRTAAAGPITIQRLDGTTRAMKFAFDVCDTCFHAAQQQLPQRCASALKRRFRGSERQAFINLISELQSTPTGYIYGWPQELVIATIRAMSDTPPSWLKNDVLHSVAALFADNQRILGRTPPIGPANSNRGWHFTISYTNSEGWGCKDDAWVRADGAIRFDQPDDHWFYQTDNDPNPPYFGGGSSELLNVLLAAVQSEPVPAAADMPFDDYLIQALGHRVHRELSPAMKQRMRTEPKLRRVVDDMFTRHRGEAVDKSNAFVLHLLGTFHQHDPDTGREYFKGPEMPST